MPIRVPKTCIPKSPLRVMHARAWDSNFITPTCTTSYVDLAVAATINAYPLMHYQPTVRPSDAKELKDFMKLEYNQLRYDAGEIVSP